MKKHLTIMFLFACLVCWLALSNSAQQPGQSSPYVAPASTAALLCFGFAAGWLNSLLHKLRGSDAMHGGRIGRNRITHRRLVELRRRRSGRESVQVLRGAAFTIGYICADRDRATERPGRAGHMGAGERRHLHGDGHRGFHS